MLTAAAVAADGSPDGGLTVGARIGQLETAVVGVVGRVDLIESRQDRHDGRIDVIVAVGKWILGTSLIGTAIAVVTLWLLLTGGNAK